MTGIYCAAFFAAGAIFGGVTAFLLNKIASRKSEDKLYSALDAATGLLKDSFADISLNALSKTTDQMIRIASEKLSSEREISFREIAGQKEQIEGRIERLNAELSKLTDLVNAMEGKRSSQLGELRSVIAESQARTAELYQVAHNLKETLSSKQSRGQWAERMADDVLSFSGLREGINYARQARDVTTGNRPDFTFFLPNGMKLNMDVKFPFENYQKYTEASDKDKSQYLKEFMKDVRNHVKAVSSREYINPEDSTVDCALLFIPNERIYGFIFDSDKTVLDEACRKGVLLCSPVTVLSVLAVIRQAADNFAVEKKARELLSAVGVFRKEWAKYAESFDKLGVHIERLSAEYRDLKTARTSKLENSVGKLEAIKSKSEIEAEAEDF